jgi:hypothetical protein
LSLTACSTLPTALTTFIQSDADGQSQHPDKGQERRPAGGADDVQNVLPVNQHRVDSSKPSGDKLRKSRAGWQDLALG